MRTTIDFDLDVVKALEKYRGETQKGVSESVNDLIRSAITGRSTPLIPTNFQLPIGDLGLRIDISNIAEVLELLDGEPT